MLVLCLVAAVAQAGKAPANLALHKACVFNVAPDESYRGATAAALTDGVIPTAKSGDPLEGTVGWRYGNYKTVRITIDLRQIEPISGVSLTSVGGFDLHTHPISILIQTSEDGVQFVTVGDMAKLDANGPIPIFGTASVHTFVTHDLRTKGRYVRFVCVTPTPIFHCSEVEVYQGDPAWLTQTAEGEVIQSEEVLNPLELTQLGIRRRLLQDIRLVRQAVNTTGKPSDRAAMLAQLSSLEVQAKQQNYPQQLENFEASWPVNDLDRQVFAIRGQLLKAHGHEPITLWHKPPYELLDLMAVPPRKADKSLSLSMMLNEHRARSFNVTNASAQAATIKFRLVGLPDGDNPAYVKVSQVRWMDTRVGLPRDLLLSPLTAREGWYEVEVPAGFTQEIWLSFNPTKVASGMYHGQIEVASDHWVGKMALDLTLAPIRFPDQVDFTLGVWDYMFEKLHQVMEGNQLALKELFLSHFGNMPWLGYGLRLDLFADKAFDAEGNLVGKIDYSQWDAFVRFWPDVKYHAVTVERVDAFGPIKIGTPQWDRAITAFAADWARHNRNLGLKPNQVIVSFGDEPNTPQMFQKELALAKAFRRGTQDMLIYINPLVDDPASIQYGRQAVELANIVMPERTRFDRGQNDAGGRLYQELRTEGKLLMVYSCAGGKQLYSGYYRLQPWTAFAHGGDGEGFWALTDAGVSNGWNDYTAHGTEDYSPLYVAPNRAASTKFWEAVREGVEDWQYLKMLADAGQEKEARSIARKIHGQIMGQYGLWYGMDQKSNDACQLAEQGRLEALKRLETIKK
ncbi:MAG: discoidin domain-containing protein [Phycisphaerales bacterium]|nr:discoidin domain-containing protein [Phycisphaerales bacterium]